MFEEFKNLKKIDLPFLQKNISCFSELLALYTLKLLEINTIKDFLSKIITVTDIKVEEETIIISMLITDNEHEFISMLVKLSEIQKVDVKEKRIFRPIWLILKWFEYLDCLPVPGFALIEFCSDLLVHFNFPELEKKLFSKSFSEWNIVADNVKSYLEMGRNGTPLTYCDRCKSSKRCNSESFCGCLK